MPERANPSLSEILNTFRQSMTKTAGEEGMADPAAVDPSVAGPAPQHPEGCECPECVPSAVDAADALKAIADDYIEERTDTISKEAQLFGQLFAASCMEQMNKTAHLQEREARAYNLAANAIAENGMNKVAAEQMNSVYDEAWRTSMAKLAGFDSPEEMEELAERELTPEEILAIVEAAQNEAQGEEDAEASELAALIAEEQEAGDGDLSDEEIQAIAAQLAEAEDGGEAAETDPEAVAAAANLLAEARDGEIDEELDKAASAAYDTTTDALLAGNFQKTAEEAYDLVLDTIWNDRLVKTAEEAYALTAQALGF